MTIANSMLDTNVNLLHLILTTRFIFDIYSNFYNHINNNYLDNLLR